jgi:hypothetical protein
MNTLRHDGLMAEDINQRAHRLGTESTIEKSPDAVAHGGLGGLSGSAAKAKNLSASEPKGIARKGGKPLRNLSNEIRCP